MRKLFALAVVFTWGLALGLCFRGGSPTAIAIGSGEGGGIEKCAAMNGDVNGSGSVDLSDAVTVLNFLFLGNPTQLVPLCAAQGASGLPTTGQTDCYRYDEEQGWVPDLSCFKQRNPCPGQDGYYEAGCPSVGRFVDNGDGTVADNCTGLMWQKDTADVNGDGIVIDDRTDTLQWCAALRYCDNLSFAGHDDWRLPNVRELQSIVDYGRFSPAIDPVFGALDSVYWSSTTHTADRDLAWLVHFFHFHDSMVRNFDAKGNLSYVRAVRNAP